MYPLTIDDLHCMYDGPIPAESMQAARRLEALPLVQRKEILARYELDRRRCAHNSAHRQCVKLAVAKAGETPEQAERRRKALTEARVWRTHTWQSVEAGKKILSDAIAAREASGLPRMDWCHASAAPVPHVARRAVA